MLRRVALVRIDVSEQRIAFIFKVERNRELGTTLAVSSRQQHFPPKRLFLQEPHGVTSQKTTFFIVIAMKTSNLT
jgi:hypothetical protein